MFNYVIYELLFYLKFIQYYYRNHRNEPIALQQTRINTINYISKTELLGKINK